MFVCGYNDFNQLCEESNQKGLEEYHIINPSKKSHFDVSTILSFSTYHCHSVLITQNKEAYAIGDNKDGKICGSINKTIFKKETKFVINDKNRKPCQFYSAVCGYDYTLYLATTSNKQNYDLIYCFKRKNPLFLNIGNHNPRFLFGGISVCATINDDSSIFIIKESIFSSPNKQIIPYSIPNCDEPIKIACNNNSVIVLSSSGKIYELILNDEKSLFKEIDELQGKRVVDISGSYNHFILVCDDYTVFGRGSNQNFRIGLPDEDQNYSKFTEIKVLADSKIVSVFAAASHSLFITSEGNVIGCGTNGCGQLMLKDGICQPKVYPPKKAEINGVVPFCITGNAISIIFLNVMAPQNTPNQIRKDVNGFEKFIEASKYLNIAKNYAILEKEYQNELKEKKSLLKQIQEDKIKMKELELKLRNTTIRSGYHPLQIIDAKTLNEYKIIRKVGKGATAEVFEVVRENHFALKQIDITLYQNGEQSNNQSENDVDYDKEKQLLREYEVINKLDHPNIIKTYGIFFGDSTHLSSILLEYCPYTLKDRITLISDSKKVSIIIEVAFAMKEIHRVGIIHRDLKLENILLDEEDHAKVGDFGICTMIQLDQSKSSRTQMVGTLKYMAPEVLKESKDYNEKIDVYAFGIVVFLILTGGEFPNLTIEDVLNGKNVTIPNYFTQYAHELIQKCLSFKACDRPSFHEICGTLVRNENNII